jgi:DNA-binding phage protein
MKSPGGMSTITRQASMTMEHLERQVADAAASLHGMTVCE